MESIVFLGLSLAAWLTIALLLLMFGLMSFTKIPAELVFVGGMGFLYVTGVLDVKDALSGFSSTSVVVIGVLFVVIGGLVHTGVIHWIVKKMLGVPKNYSGAVIRLMMPVAALSSVLSNTTVVALFIKVVKVWARKLSIAPSKLLIPLSYASCLGGICTLIGTPPNLIISGMLKDDAGIDLNVFSTTIPGIFCLVVGVATIIFMRRLIPVRKSPDEAFGETKDYTVELLVPTDNPNVGKTVDEAGLLNVDGGRLLEIVRFDREVVCPVPADEFIMGGDRLVYTGQLDSIIDLRNSHGLTTSTKHVFSLDEVKSGRKFFTATVRRGSVLLGQSMETCDFEEQHDTVLVAVFREGERIDQNPRSVVIQYRDVLLFECSPQSGKALQKSTEKDLYFFLSDDVPYTGKKTIVSALIMIAMVALSTFGVMTLLQAAFIAALLMLLLRCCTPQQAWQSINWSVLMVFAGSVSLGIAIDKTGIASMLANGILSVCGTNPLVALIAICLVATFATEFVSNTAAAAIFYPIAYQTATTLGANPVTFCIALMIAVSSSFATPIGSPTHMLVYTEGGYRFSDFMRIGIVMNLVILAANIFIVTLVFPL